MKQSAKNGIPSHEGVPFLYVDFAGSFYYN